MGIQLLGATYKAPIYKRGKMKGEGNEKIGDIMKRKKKRPASGE